MDSPQESQVRTAVDPEEMAKALYENMELFAPRFSFQSVDLLWEDLPKNVREYAIEVTKATFEQLSLI